VSDDDILTATVAYDDGGIPLTGVLHWNAGQSAARPGILLVHGGAGLDEHARQQARRYARLAVLALARSGAPLAAAVSIHGSLATSAPAEPGAVRASVLVCHGAMDPHVPMDHVTAFADEMHRAGGARWQLIMYGGAQHGFTHQHAVPGAMPGVAYDPAADQGSFAATSGFLAEALAGGPVGEPG
jgi:dienelactone hydrolase